MNQAELRMKAMYGVNREINGTYAQQLAVRCENGTFVGVETDGVLAFKGIPYAKPPVGKRRWKRPEKAASRKNIRKAASRKRPGKAASLKNTRKMARKNGTK